MTEVLHNSNEQNSAEVSGTVKRQTSYPPEALNCCFALLDCNNFYASCERVFNPKLKDQPIIVLSSNDGCIIARSNETKALGIQMGEPFFKSRDIVRKHNVQVLSSNYALYGDMSRRIMNILTSAAPEIEIYSIDEAFLNFSGCDRLNTCENLTEYAREIRERVERDTGVPVSIGIARTKTLAKIANHIAKKSPKAKGVLNLMDVPFMDQALERVPVGNVWGIGRRSVKWLNSLQITNARQLRDMDETTMINHRGIMGQRLLEELRGISCFTLDTDVPPSKSILSSRSFGQKVTSLDQIRGAVATHVTIAAEKLRRQGSAVNVLVVFLLTRHGDIDDDKGGDSATVRLPRATNNTAELIHHAMHGVERAFKYSHTYKKAGVVCLDIIPEDQVQATLFDPGYPGSNRQLMEMIDRVNTRMGRGTLQYAVQIPAQPLRVKCAYSSPRFTTNWRELVTVYAK